MHVQVAHYACSRGEQYYISNGTNEMYRRERTSDARTLRAIGFGFSRPHAHGPRACGRAGGDASGSAARPLEVHWFSSITARERPIHARTSCPLNSALTPQRKTRICQGVNGLSLKCHKLVTSCHRSVTARSQVCHEMSPRCHELSRASRTSHGGRYRSRSVSGLV